MQEYDKGKKEEKHKEGGAEKERIGKGEQTRYQTKDNNKGEEEQTREKLKKNGTNQKKKRYKTNEQIKRKEMKMYMKKNKKEESKYCVFSSYQLPLVFFTKQ